MDATNRNSALWWIALAAAIDRHTRIARDGAASRSRFTGACRVCGDSTENVVKWGDGTVFLCPPCGAEIRAGKAVQ
jgi:predicted RNA-binding Zn-ribbon protein involved in translation (DUF1610 family)